MTTKTTKKTKPKKMKTKARARGYMMVEAAMKMDTHTDINVKMRNMPTVKMMVLLQ